jgi:hypothetical protein
MLAWERFLRRVGREVLPLAWGCQAGWYCLKRGKQLKLKNGPFWSIVHVVEVYLVYQKSDFSKVVA